MKGYIFGARAIAISVYRALNALYGDLEIRGFLVTSLKNNPHEIDGIPVEDICTASNRLTRQEKQQIRVFIAVPEDIHGEASETVQKYGFANLVPVNACVEAKLMEKYYRLLGRFPSIHDLAEGCEIPKISVYAARFHKDRPLKTPPQFPEYVYSILLGCSMGSRKELEKSADFCDNTGDHISEKNPNYCEMTAFYWIWKNALENGDEYVGVYHYRRALDLSESDLKKIRENDVDVVLPYPLIHLPDIREHHTRYIKEEDWQVLQAAMRELYPAYAEAYEEICTSIFFYNYNLIIAKKGVFASFCKWVFPLLARVEELSVPKGWERKDRYTAYMSESLLTLYFLFHKELKIYHTGRILYT